MANAGHYVTCVDIDENKIEIMRKGISPIYEPGLEELMAKNMERLTFTNDYKSAYTDAEVIFVGVGTPEKKMIRESELCKSSNKSDCSKCSERLCCCNIINSSNWNK